MPARSEYPIKTVGWGLLRIPGERKRMLQLKDKYDRWAILLDREGSLSTGELGDSKTSSASSSLAPRPQPSTTMPVDVRRRAASGDRYRSRLDQQSKPNLLGLMLDWLDRLWSSTDDAAARRGWQVGRPSAATRVYRDPRWVRRQQCTACHGTGRQTGPGSGARCLECDGTGVVQSDYENDHLGENDDSTRPRGSEE